MSTAQAADAPSHDRTAADARGSYLRERLGSFLAVMPLGVWVLIHLWNNLAAFKGGEEWQQAVTVYPHPLAQFATAVVVLLPLLLHTAWGIKRLTSSRPNNASYNTFANFKYVLQRLSAIGVLLFIGAHLWLAFLKPRLAGRPEEFSEIASEMAHHTPTLAVYLLGTLGVSYHLANGIQTFMMGWGVVSSQRALKKVGVLNYLLFGIFLAMSWGAIYALHTAGTPLPPLQH